jgi:hypothetical protein
MVGTVRENALSGRRARTGHSPPATSRSASMPRRPASSSASRVALCYAGAAQAIDYGILIGCSSVCPTISMTSASYSLIIAKMRGTTCEESFSSNSLEMVASPLAKR